MSEQKTETENMNILLDKKVRIKRKNCYRFFMFSFYYQREDISLKEKLYTLWYNLHRKGSTTQGEMDWEMTIMSMDIDYYQKLEKEFKKDYIEYLKQCGK